MTAEGKQLRPIDWDGPARKPPIADAEPTEVPETVTPPVQNAKAPDVGHAATKAVSWMGGWT
jgi:hypothetical protein